MAEGRVAWLCLKRTFGARDPNYACVGFESHSQGTSRSFEDRFADVVAVAAVVHEDVQVAERAFGEGVPEFFDQFAVEVADLRGRNIGVKRHRETAAQIDCDSGKRFV